MSGAAVAVRLPGGALATIYADDGVTPTANPITSDNKGYFEFYAADGLYNIFVNGVETYSDVLVFDTMLGVQGAVKTVDLAASGGAGLVGFLQSGADAVLRTTQDKQRERRSVEDFHSGGSDYSLAFERAIAAGIDTLYLGPTIYDHDNDLLLPNGFSIVGRAKNVSGFRYHGTGKALSLRSIDEPVIRSYSHFLANFLVMGDGRLAGIGIDMDSVSEAMLLDVTVANFTKGITLHSNISGGCVYNRYMAVKAQNCDVGFDLFRDGAGISSYTSDNVLTNGSRANSCDIGVRISGGNHNLLTMQIEACDIGVDIIEPAVASCIVNTAAFCRFENNATVNIRIGAGVTHTILEENVHIDGTPLIDAGARTQTIGTYASATSHKRVSPYQIAEGSFRYERSANGGSGVPMLVMHEQSSINSPVTAEVHNAATSNDASFFRGRFGGDAGTIKFDIQPRSGKIRSLGTTNGPVGSFTLGAAVSTVVNNTAIAAASLIFLQPANPAAAQLVAAKGLYVSARTADTSFQVTTGDATAAAGTEIFWYWLVN